MPASFRLSVTHRLSNISVPLGGDLVLLANNQIIVLDENCYIDLDQEDLVKNGLRISLSKRQSRLLYRLSQNLGYIVCKRELITYVWGMEGDFINDSLYVCINRIRTRLEDDIHHPKYLLSAKGIGYMLRSIKR
jgi:DNA-binding response OmpR family regulator